MKKKTAICFGIGAALLLVFAPPAEAYIDPGTGSMALQLALAGLAAAAATLRIFWRRLVVFFRGRGRSPSEGTSEVNKEGGEQ
jgi:hypothetical protein